MDIVEKVQKEILTLSEKYMLEAEDHYNFWEEHIKLVSREALGLAAMYHADFEIVELAALLHDIALVTKTGTRADHHINGAELAQGILGKYGYPKEKTARVVRCVLNHRSSKNGITVEELCVADADILAHFDNVSMMFSNVLKGRDITLPEVRERLANAFAEDYHDLSEQTKQAFGDQYKLICRIVLGVEDAAT